VRSDRIRFCIMMRETKAFTSAADKAWRLQSLADSRLISDRKCLADFLQDRDKTAQARSMESKTGLLKFLFLIEAKMMQDPVHFSMCLIPSYPKYSLDSIIT
jgi:hypothetical protein